MGDRIARNEPLSYWEYLVIKGIVRSSWGAYHLVMARNTIGPAPFPPVVTIDKDAPLTVADLKTAFDQRDGGVSICVRYASGHEKRGGYFFHIQPLANGQELYSLFDFEKRHLVDLEFDALLRFINHLTGRVFDQATFDLCATELNFLTDD
jgi:hypothetical protein